MEVVSVHQLEQPQIKQYEDLLEEAKSESFFYGVPLNHMTDRQVIIVNGQVAGAFEFGKAEYEGRSYHRTNCPYTMRAFRGQGIMLDALSHWYAFRRPAMCWIDDENVSSIRLFQNLGFRKASSLFHKGKDGSVYFLTKDA